MLVTKIYVHLSVSFILHKTYRRCELIMKPKKLKYFRMTVNNVCRYINHFSSSLLCILSCNTYNELNLLALTITDSEQAVLHAFGVRGHTLHWERDVAQSIACPPLKRSVVGSILLSGPSCSLGYFPFQPVVHNWFIKGRGMYCSLSKRVAYVAAAGFLLKSVST